MTDTRVGSLSANNELVNLILKTQRRIQERQTQVTSEKVSQVYSGLSRDAQRLVNLETLNTSLEQFIKNNDAMKLRVDVATDVVQSAQDVIGDFQDALTAYSIGGRKDEDAVENIQDWAFRSLQSMQALLNTQADGRYIFSGARVLTPPADMGLTTLEDFQSVYDGARVTYPTTRDAHLANFSMSNNGAATPDTTWLQFERDAGGTGVSRITANAAQFSNIAVGTKITVSGTASNNGTYTVSAIGGGGTTIDVVTEMLTDEVAVPITVTYDDPLSRNDQLLLSGTVTFNRAASTINHGGALDDIPVGAAFTVADSANNDGTYTVVSNSGGIITIASRFFTDEGAGSTAAGTISADSYYNGDLVELTHRVDKDRTFTFDLNGVDPAFEKAIRAMALIAQGAFGSEGGLDQNPDRINDALYLLSSSLERVVVGTPPFGTEETSNLAYVEQTLGFNAVLLSDTNDAHDRFIGFLETSISDIENVDPTETITRLLDDTRALEASYQALARIRELSLVNFLPV